MPLTFPSHAAAIVPLLRLPGVRRLPPSALVIGSTAPDLTYLLPTLGGAVAAAQRFRHPYPRLSRTLWEAGWSGVAWFALLLGVVCLLVRRRRSPQRD